MPQSTFFLSKPVLVEIHLSWPQAIIIVCNIIGVMFTCLTWNHHMMHPRIRFVFFTAAFYMSSLLCLRPINWSCLDSFKVTFVVFLETCTSVILALLAFSTKFILSFKKNKSVWQHLFVISPGWFEYFNSFQSSFRMAILLFSLGLVWGWKAYNCFCFPLYPLYILVQYKLYSSPLELFQCSKNM